MRKKLLFIIIILLLALGAFSYRVKIKNLFYDLQKSNLPEAVNFQKTKYSTSTELINESVTENQLSPSKDETPVLVYPENKTLPDSYNLNVPFTSQAPFANWDETFKEACEEAAALIVHYYYQNKNFTKDIATEEILKMVDWQIDNWGGHFDLTASQTAQLIKDYWGYKKIEIINNPTVEEIKNHLFKKRPVIVPAAGRELNNPYFRQPGPIYHMLVIKGYTKNEFITNDPGTKRGEDFMYSFETIINSIHDWNEENILQGEKRIIVIYPN
ncbi:C39 family peptidase [Patescibacteria group bacterium]|nr:C39 family peptidase [Patescibacteria group bacterium]